MIAEADRRVVVVGSGPAGAMAATFLSRAGVDVVLLEAGALRSELGLTARVRGMTFAKVRKALKARQDVAMTGDPGAILFEEIAPGGLSNHWSCAVPRFGPDDFADAARAGEEYEWPIRYDDLAPYYDRVEPLLKIAGPVESAPQVPAGKVRRSCRLARDWSPLADEVRKDGRSLIPMPYVYGAESTVTLSGTPFNSYVRLVRPLLASGRLSVRHGARVERLEWSPSSKRVTAVVYRDQSGGGETRIPCRAVVLAAGAIATPEILLASESADFPEGLGNTHGVLGRYLHDHPWAKIMLDLSAPLSFLPPAYLTRQTLDRAPPLYTAACVQWSGVPLLATSAYKGRPGRMPWVGFSVFGTMAPARENGISRDPRRPAPDGRAGLSLHIRMPDDAVRALERIRDDVVGALSRAGLDPRLRLWEVAVPGTSVHFGGTCRMHKSARFGVIDGRSRLHAAPNVVVADSSAFTTGPEKNPALTAMTLSARASQLLADDMRAGDI